MVARWSTSLEVPWVITLVNTILKANLLRCRYGLTHSLCGHVLIIPRQDLCDGKHIVG